MSTDVHAIADAGSLRGRLHAAQLRPTLGRIEVLQILANSAQPLCADAIFHLLAQRGSPVAAGTVPRIVRDLERCRLIERASGPDQRGTFRVCQPTAPAQRHGSPSSDVRPQSHPE